MADRLESPYDRPVQGGVQGQQDEVVQQCRAHEPQRHTEPVAGEEPYTRVGGERERAGEQEQGEGAPGRDPRPSHHRSPNVIRATHLVLSTPGAAGTMIRAG
ncbi:hypothetical protein GCM10010304_53470 [Streptomyces roseoviolaceus]